MKKKKILFFVTEDWYFLSHRIKLAKYLIEKGYDVSVCCKDTGKIKNIIKEGVNFYNLNIHRKSLSLYNFFFEIFSFRKVLNEVNFDIVHFISLRPIVVGIIASFYIKKKYFATFTGMGFLFIKRGLIAYCIKFIIMKIIKLFIISNKLKIIVQNKDDQKLLSIRYKIYKKSINIIRGSGIDLNYYNFSPERKGKNIKLAYAGRLLEDKGIFLLIESFKEAKKINKHLSLHIAGSFDKNNPTSISRSYFNYIKSIEGIYYHGNISDVRNFWKESNIAVLFSKREGLPMSLMEAASTGRAIISTNVTGSREIAISGYNAITFEPGDMLAAKKAIIKLSKSQKLRKEYGYNSRKLVKRDLQLEHICNQYYKLYNIT